MKKHLDDFVFGTHYYRSPTPPPSEWEDDLKRIKECHISTIQFRANWASFERKKGEFNWDDSDRLFALAEKQGLRVNFKFLLECAPHWLYDEYHAWRVAPSGNILHPYSRGAFYPGGFMPCFDRNDVRKEAERFIAAAVIRYCDKKNLLLWNVWNEPRSRPFGECACAFSNEKYRAFLQKRFETIEAFNDFFGFAWGNFDQITPPVSHRNYADIILWRLFRTEMVADRVGWIAKHVRSLDDSRPIIAHSGFASPLMDPLTDITNDYLNGKELDFYGSSSPTRDIDISYLRQKKWPHKYTITPLVCDRLRGIDDYFFAHELYPNNADFEKPIPDSDMELDVWNAIAGGAKGIMFWQYKSERLGDEVNRSGLVKVSGEPTGKYRAAQAIGKTLEAHPGLFRHSKLCGPKIGIIYDITADLLSRLQVTREGNYPDTTMHGLDDYEYKRAIRGAHMLFWDQNIPTDIVPSENPAKIHDYPCVYFPFPIHVSDELERELVNYVEQGGTLICEASPGLRQKNFWLASQVPGGSLRKLFGCVEEERYYEDQICKISLLGKTLKILPGEILSVLKAENGKPIGSFARGRIMAVENVYGKGKAILLGFSPGVSFFDRNDKEAQQAVIKAFGKALPSPLIKLRVASPRLKYRVHSIEGGHLLFLMNFGSTPSLAHSAELRKARVIHGDLQPNLKKGAVRVPPNSCVVLTLSKIS
jgi:beta-galactosidase GanA